MVLHSTFGMWKSGSIPTFSTILIKIGEVKDVNFIRRNYSYNNKIYSLNKLAQKFNVSKNTILKIIKEKTWKNDYGAMDE